MTLNIGGDSTAAYEIETTDHCDPATNSGYTGWDIAMWDWIGYVDPDFMLSVVTKGQWCSWSDTGWDNPDYDALYEKQGTTVDEDERASIVQQMEQMIYDNWVYTQLVEEQYIDAHTTAVGRHGPAPERVREDVLDAAAQGRLGEAKRKRTDAGLRLRRKARALRSADGLRRYHAQLRPLPHPLG